MAIRATFTLLVASGVSIVGLACLGCGKESPAPSSTGQPAPMAARPVELTDITLAGLDEFVAKQKGKVVLIDCWATTCSPCVKLFPHTVALHEKHEKEGLVVVTLTTDPDDYRVKALKFLKDKNATCVNFFLADPKPSKELEVKYPTEALPAIILFDRTGNRAKALTYSEVDEKAVDLEVERLLAGS